MDLISSVMRDSVNQSFRDVHDTFKRPIYVARKGDTVWASQDSTNFNFGYGTQGDQSNVSGVDMVTGICSGRIAYLDIRYTTSKFVNDFAMGDDIYRGDARMRLDLSGFMFVKGAENIVLDGRPYQLKSEGRQHGMFTPDWYDVFLVRS